MFIISFSFQNVIFFKTRHIDDIRNNFDHQIWGSNSYKVTALSHSHFFDKRNLRHSEDLLKLFRDKNYIQIRWMHTNQTKSYIYLKFNPSNLFNICWTISVQIFWSSSFNTLFGSFNIVTFSLTNKNKRDLKKTNFCFV